MSNIKNAFKDGKAFIAFLTGGDPSLSKCEEYIFEMIRAGADLIEIGIPFSDPVAEGIVIQNANIRALSAGTNTEKIFGLVESVRKKSSIPLVFLTYLNPVFHYGYETFFARCKETGVDGIIIPDLPFEEQGEVKTIAGKYDVDVVSLIAPTSDERIRKLSETAEGFLYIVSSMGVTGVRSEIKTDVSAIIKEVKSVTDLPAAIGFGINTPEQARSMADAADGVIVGSAIVKLIEKYGDDAGAHIFHYVKEMKDSIR